MPRVRACVRAVVRAIVRARVRAGRGRWAAQCRYGPLGIGPGQPLFTLAGEARPRSRICCSGLCGQCSSCHRAQRVDVLVVVLELGHDGHRSKRREADEQLHRLGDVDRNVPSKAHRASAGSAGRHVEANDHVDVLAQPARAPQGRNAEKARLIMTARSTLLYATLAQYAACTLE